MLAFINDVQIELADDCEGFYTCTLPNGKQVEVSLSLGTVFVYVPRKAGQLVTRPRGFATLTDAVEGYKSKDVKKALRALISHLV